MVRGRFPSEEVVDLECGLDEGDCFEVVLFEEVDFDREKPFIAILGVEVEDDGGS